MRQNYLFRSMACISFGMISVGLEPIFLQIMNVGEYLIYYVHYVVSILIDACMQSTSQIYPTSMAGSAIIN
jgi:hypothetical protein